MMAITPGEWHLRADDTGCDLYAGNPWFGEKKPIARIHWFDRSQDEDISNAGLLVASPDLLAAARALVASVTQSTDAGNVYALSELHQAVEMARAAIAKAES